MLCQSMRILIHVPEKWKVLRNSKTLLIEATAFWKGWGLDSFNLHPLKKPKRYGKIMSPCLQLIVSSCAHAALSKQSALQAAVERGVGIDFLLALPTSHYTAFALCSTYTGAKKDWHPYYIKTIEMRSLWMEINYLKSPARLLNRD